MTRNERLLACERSIDAVIEELQEIVTEIGSEQMAQQRSGEDGIGKSLRQLMNVAGTLEMTSVFFGSLLVMNGVRGMEDKQK